MPHCLMLDVDGVLISGRPSDGKFWTYTLQADLGLSPDDLVRTFFTPLWPQVVTGQRDLRPALIEALAQLGTNLDADTLIDYWFRMDSRIVAQVLHDVRAARRDGMRVFLATNQDHARAHYLMNQLNLRAEVDGILTSAQAGVQKPDSGFYAFAQDVTQAQPSEILFVDDTLQNIDAARTAGWTALHWTPDMRLADFIQRKTP